MYTSYQSSKASQTINHLHHENLRLLEELSLRQEVSLKINAMTWLSAETRLALLQALPQVSAEQDPLHGKALRILVSERIDNLRKNMLALIDLLPHYCQHYQDSIEKERGTRQWVSFQWYIRTYHYYTGIDKAIKDMNHLWRAQLKKSGSKLDALLQVQLQSWAKQAQLPLNCDEILSQCIDQMIVETKTLLKKIPIQTISPVSYETYLIAYLDTLKHIQRAELSCDNVYGQREYDYWFKRFYEEAYQGIAKQAATLGAAHLNKSNQQLRQ